MNIRAFCGSHRGFLQASCSENWDGPLFYGHRGPVGVVLLLVSLWGAVCAHSRVWFKHFVAVHKGISNAFLSMSKISPQLKRNIFHNRTGTPS